MPERFAELVRAVGAFHLTERAMRGEQKRIEAALATGTPDPAAVRAYLTAVRAYFAPYQRESQAQLAHVDRQLARLYQLQNNFAAERGVVVKRVDAVRGVLDTLAELAHE